MKYAGLVQTLSPSGCELATSQPEQIWKQSFFAAAATHFNLAFLPRFFVGYFPDDALYILGARSLLHGQYKADYLHGRASPQFIFRRDIHFF